MLGLLLLSSRPSQLLLLNSPFHYLGAGSTSPLVGVHHSSSGSLSSLSVFCSVPWPELKIFVILYIFSCLLFFFLFFCHGCIFLFEFEVRLSAILFHTQECSKGCLVGLIFSSAVDVYKFFRSSHHCHNFRLLLLTFLFKSMKEPTIALRT